MMGYRTLIGVLECRVEMVDDLCEDIGRPLIALLVQQVKSQAPFAHGKVRHGRWFVAISPVSLSSTSPRPCCCAFAKETIGILSLGLFVVALAVVRFVVENLHYILFRDDPDFPLLIVWVSNILNINVLRMPSGSELWSHDD